VTGDNIPFIELDWKAYWEHFKAVHGEHVEYEGKLLFPDGWRYSATDYSGPEYPPDGEQERQRWIVIYWQTRLSYCRQELVYVNDLYVRMKQLAAARSAPLFQFGEVKIGDDGLLTQEESVPLDLESLEGRIGWLKEDINRARKMVLTLTDTSQPFHKREEKAMELSGASYG
jgi:hypothetical protein